jgi:rubrerythrin
MDAEWECIECGYVFQGEKPPGQCPDCEALDSFEQIEYVEEWEEEAAQQPSQPEWECLECGCIIEGEKPPGQCPDCKALDSFEQIEYVKEWEEVEADPKGDEEATAFGWECAECGYFVDSEGPPQRCPQCNAVDAWMEVEYFVDWDEEEAASEEQEVNSDAP